LTCRYPSFRSNKSVQPQAASCHLKAEFAVLLI